MILFTLELRNILDSRLSPVHLQNGWVSAALRGAFFLIGGMGYDSDFRRGRDNYEPIYVSINNIEI